MQDHGRRYKNLQEQVSDMRKQWHVKSKKKLQDYSQDHLEEFQNLRIASQFMPGAFEYFDDEFRLFQRIFRSCRPEVFCKKDFLRNFTKLTGKHLCQSLFFNKVAGLRPTTLLKRDSNTCFPVNFVKFLRIPLVAASEFFEKYNHFFLMTIIIKSL